MSHPTVTGPASSHKSWCSSQQDVLGGYSSKVVHYAVSSVHHSALEYVTDLQALPLHLRILVPSYEGNQHRHQGLHGAALRHVTIQLCQKEVTSCSSSCQFSRYVCISAQLDYCCYSLLTQLSFLQPALLSMVRSRAQRNIALAAVLHHCQVRHAYCTEQARQKLRAIAQT